MIKNTSVLSKRTNSSKFQVNVTSQYNLNKITYIRDSFSFWIFENQKTLIGLQKFFLN